MSQQGHAGRYKITATHPDYAPNSINIDTTEASLPPEADIYLQKDNTIGGFVTDPSGQAIQNVTVAHSDGFGHPFRLHFGQ